LGSLDRLTETPQHVVGAGWLRAAVADGATQVAVVRVSLVFAPAAAAAAAPGPASSSSPLLHSEAGATTSERLLTYPECGKEEPEREAVAW
jgi:hypothetical protein